MTTYERVVALYDYSAQGPEELSLIQGDIIVILEKIDEVICTKVPSNRNL